MIENATFVSVWDNDTEISSSCLVDTETKEIFDIEVVDVEDMDLDICTEEYIIFSDGTRCDIDFDDGYWCM